MLSKMVSENIFQCSEEEEKNITDSNILLDNKLIKFEIDKFKNKKKQKNNKKAKPRLLLLDIR